MNKIPELIASSGDSLREAFGKKLISIANKYPKVVVLDADIAGGTGMHHFREKFPERFGEVVDEADRKAQVELK